MIHIGRASAQLRKPGYMDALQKVGTPVTRFGMPFLQLTDADYAGIRKEFAIAPLSILKPDKFKLSPRNGKPLVKTPLVKTTGLGDLISSVATPIARALNLDCIDKATGQLKPDSGCAKRRELANKIQLPI